eukprot:TRINITY_DN8321_c0_g2_i1.p1 TRINITY_DN8321_c0_g2~~TRINITY_DN8321_c0_g2_i1.p1  ORF type:complete len:229 (+),score=58.41 TRINITY_DN8321_c0_g2_i1:52-687(+)
MDDGPSHKPALKVKGKEKVKEKGKTNEYYEQLDDPAFVRGSKQYGPPTEILPHVFLGSGYNAKDQSIIDAVGIGYILNVADEIDDKPPKWYKGKYLKMVIQDHVEEHKPQYATFEKLFEIFDECEKSGTKCLIHCARGRSRSATVVIAYLMQRKSMTLKNAHNHVKELRPLVGPHKNLKVQLLAYDFLLYNKHSIDPTSISWSIKKPKINV